MLTGQKITELRMKNNLTQTELAQKIFVSQQLVSQWEKGTRRPDSICLKKMAEIFGVETEEIISANEMVFSELSDCLPADWVADDNKLREYINNFMTLLSEKERYIFIRRYYFTDEYSVIARRLNIKENQARTVLSRTRKKFAKYLSEVTK